MNRELPKALQDALARQTAGEVHPSPDLLTAFAEHNLPGRESQRVTEHLAECADCREVLFLASSAVEEPVGEENEWMQADAISRISPVLRAKAATPSVASGGRTHAESRRRWMLRWAWVPPVAAVLIVSGILYQRRSEFMRGAPVTMSSKGPPPATTAAQPPSVAPLQKFEAHSSPETRTAFVAPKPLAKSAQVQARTAESFTTAKVAPSIPQERAFAPNTSAAPAPPSSDTQGSLDALLKAAPAVPMQNGFAESEAPTASDLVAKQPLVGGPQMAKQVVSAAHPRWRITPDGHLEQRSASGNWTRVLAEQPVTFHVVSVVGDNVWAGGNGGALFHSNDRGQNWSKQPIGSPPGVETDTITAIRFSDELHGVVTTDSGARWSTLDGGVTWTKE